jgi:hypothetical protein
MTFYYCLNGTRAWGYFGALVTLHKDLSVSEHPGFYSTTVRAIIRDENGTDIFRPYSRPNPFRGVLIRPYPSSDI